MLYLLYLREPFGDFQFRPDGDEVLYSNIPNGFHLIKEIEDGGNMRIRASLGSAFIESINDQN
jgi:hypothetical protein